MSFKSFGKYQNTVQEKDHSNRKKNMLRLEHFIFLRLDFRCQNHLCIILLFLGTIIVFWLLAISLLILEELKINIYL